MSEITEDTTLDVKEENCPMPVIKTKQESEKLNEEEILKVVATDSGSMSDIKGWAEGTDNMKLLEQQEEDGLYIHYLEKATV